MPKKLTRYLLLPPRGTQASAMTAGAHLANLFKSLQPSLLGPPEAFGASDMKVIDSVREDGLKLVEMSQADLLTLREAAPGVRVVPELFYRTAGLPRAELRTQTLSAAGQPLSEFALQLGYVQAGKTLPVAGADVIAFTDFAAGRGVRGRSNAKGAVALALGKLPRVERLYVYPKAKVWPLLLESPALKAKQPLLLRPIDFSAPDLLAQLAQTAGGSDGAGVTVGVVDTGSGPHPDLDLAGGANLVIGQAESEFADNGDQHGTHVAGIIKARASSAAQGMNGLAPGVTLHAYRVFAKGKGASNYSIAKAVDRAVADGCDLINMSLAGAELDPAVGAAISDARSAGVVVVCASGNDGRPQVSFPAADARAVAVGCFGRVGSFPSDSISASAVAKPFGQPDKRFFIAGFSNHGYEIDFAGPGVGIVSTVPGGLWAVMDGTSMACPALTAMMARWLGSAPQILAMPRGQARSDAIIQLAFARAAPLGFGPLYEGKGWVR